MRDETDSTLPEHGPLLDTLAKASPAGLKALAEEILPKLGDVEVLASRTGLVMLPMRDTVTGTDFHLGEVLVAEAHITLPDLEVEGYGMVTGRDLERAMAMALVDAAAAAGIALPRIAAFQRETAQAAETADEERLRRIEATRVEMETF